MTRDEAERERDRLAAEQPDSTWLVAEPEPGEWAVVKVGLQPADAPEGESEPDPEAPPEDPRTAVDRNIRPWGVTPWIGGLGRGGLNIRRRRKDPEYE